VSRRSPVGSPAQPVVDADAASRRERTSTLGFFVLSLLPVLTVLGASAPGVAQSQIADGLGESTAATAWVTVAFILAIGITRPTMGRLTDLAGVRGLMIIGSIALVVGSVGTLVSSDLFTMVVARLIQGAGVSAVSSAAFTVIGVQLEEPARSRAFGRLTAGSSFLFGMGTLIGALIVLELGWRATLASPIIALPAGLLGLYFVRDTPAPGETLDGTGAVLLFLTTACLLTLVQAGSTDLSLSVVAALAVGAAITGWLLARHTRKHPDGFVPLRSVRREGLPAQFAALGALCAFAFGFIFLGPILLADQQPSWGLVELGLWLAPAGIVGVLAAVFSGELVVRGASTSQLVALSVVSPASLLLVGTLAGPVATVVAMSAAVAAFAITQVVVCARISDAVPDGEVGVVLGLFSLVQLTGGSAGVAAAGALLDVVSVDATAMLLAVFPVIGLLSLVPREVKRPGRR
jgi:MFS family permease